MTLFISSLIASFFILHTHSAPPSVACDATSEDLWDQYVCEALDTRLDMRCAPKRWWAGLGASDDTAKGLVVMFHGYTACSAAYDVYAESFQTAGYHVLSVLNEGHGREYNDCNSTHASSGVEADCVNGDPIELLPQNRLGYLAFVDKINAIVRNYTSSGLITAASINPSFTTTAVGHSLGGGLAAIATIKGNNDDTQGKIYDKLLLLSPFFGISVPALDEQVVSCSTTDTCITDIVDAAVANLNLAPGGSTANASATSVLINVLKDTLENELPSSSVVFTYDRLMGILRYVLAYLAEGGGSLPQDLQDLLAKGYGWGDKCEEDRVSNVTKREGICNFRVRNLLAVHSQGLWALTNAHTIKYPLHTQLVGVERDGQTRNSLAFQVLNAFVSAPAIRGQSTSQLCIFRVDATCDIETDGNTCGVPHAFVAAGDVLGTPPYNMYWEDALLTSFKLFLQDGSRVGVPAPASINTGVCEQVDFTSPPANLIAAPFRVVEVVLRAGANQITASIRASLISQIAAALGVPEWLVSVIDIPNPFQQSGDNDGDMVKLFVEVPANATILFEFEPPSSSIGGLVVVETNDPSAPMTTTTTTEASAAFSAPSSFKVPLLAAVCLALWFN